MEDKKATRDYFWPSYVDLMTSLFIIMLVLFVLSYIKFSKINAELAATAKQMERIRQIDKALKGLDKKYFGLDSLNNRYKLLVDVKFAWNSPDIKTVGINSLSALKSAGGVLYDKLNKLSKDKDINYLLIIEGNAERFNRNWINDANLGYITSYKRALSLNNFWNQNGFHFSDIKNCEVLIVGSGYFGRSSSASNRTFTIQITPKFKVEK